MDMAKEAGAMYASMPCCIRDGMYGLHGARHVSDDVRSVLSTAFMLNDRDGMALGCIRWPGHHATWSNILWGQPGARTARTVSRMAFDHSPVH
jgi:hypothetical protein